MGAGMDPSAIQVQVVPAGRPIVSWALAAVAAAGKGTLAWVGIAQNNRERQCSEPGEDAAPELYLVL